MKPAPALTARQRRFVVEYLVDHNGTQAVIRAGYSRKGADVQAVRLLGNARVAAMLAAAEARLTAKVQVAAEDVLSELLLILKSDVRHFLVDDEGRLALTKDAPDLAWRAVSSVKHRTITSGSGEDQRVTREVEYRLWDKCAAARMLGEHLALFHHRISIEDLDGLSDAELTAVAAGRSPR